MQITLPPDEAHHLAHVLRLGPGADVRVFNGAGDEWSATVTTIGRGLVTLALIAPVPSIPEPSVRVTLAVGVLKGDQMDTVVRDATALGVSAITPLASANVTVPSRAWKGDAAIDRWRRIAIASAKQCGRAVVPAILEPLSFEMLVQTIAAARLHGPALILVEPGASSGTIALGDLDPAAPREATLVIGPEGGWTGEEIHAVAGLCRLLTLGDRTIRADAMAVVAIAALFARWGEF